MIIKLIKGLKKELPSNFWKKVNEGKRTTMKRGVHVNKIEINKEMNISILLNIHHVELALEYTDRIIGIRAGKIVYDGPSSEVTQEVLDSIYEGKIPTDAEEA